ncbi:MAG: type II secretion system protein [Patescibacteria group bacterium]
MKRGFTMVELVLSMGLLSVVALLAISYSFSVGSVSVDSASWRIQADIRHAQQLSTSTGESHGVIFVQGGTYTVYRGQVDDPVTDPLDGSPMVRDLSAFGGVAIDNGYQVEFNGLGKPVIGGGGDVKVVTSDGASRRIYVIENTGAVVVDVLDQGAGCGCRVCEGWRTIP